MFMFRCVVCVVVHTISVYDVYGLVFSLVMRLL